MDQNNNETVSLSLQIPGFCEGAEAAVVGFFDVIGEAAGG